MILAAGIGKRLRPLTLDKPKHMLPVGGKPILQHAIEGLSKIGIKDIFIIVNYKKQLIIEYFGSGSKFNVNINYLTQDNPAGGTGDAVNTARGKINETFILVNGDVLFDHNILKQMIEKYKEAYKSLKTEQYYLKKESRKFFLIDGVVRINRTSLPKASDEK